ncbi:hypothetical protein BY996DRAFT_6596467 [Phakopsora pachyrhizi]|nr:hypothetical protein BY996DRAFT_6596467 [Phakopsora pachyrhizi]
MPTVDLSANLTAKPAIMQSAFSYAQYAYEERIRDCGLKTRKVAKYEGEAHPGSTSSRINFNLLVRFLVSKDRLKTFIMCKWAACKRWRQMEQSKDYYQFR